MWTEPILRELASCEQLRLTNHIYHICDSMIKRVNLNSNDQRQNIFFLCVDNLQTKIYVLGQNLICSHVHPVFAHLKGAFKGSYHTTRSCDKEIKLIQPSTNRFRQCRKIGKFLQEPNIAQSKIREVLLRHPQDRGEHVAICSRGTHRTGCKTERSLALSTASVGPLGHVGNDLSAMLVMPMSA